MKRVTLVVLLSLSSTAWPNQLLRPCFNSQGGSIVAIQWKMRSFDAGMSAPIPPGNVFIRTLAEDRQVNCGTIANPVLNQILVTETYRAWNNTTSVDYGLNNYAFINGEVFNAMLVYSGVSVQGEYNAGCIGDYHYVDIYFDLIVGDRAPAWGGSFKMAVWCDNQANHVELVWDGTPQTVWSNPNYNPEATNSTPFLVSIEENRWSDDNQPHAFQWIMVGGPGSGCMTEARVTDPEQSVQVFSDTYNATLPSDSQPSDWNLTQGNTATWNYYNNAQDYSSVNYYDVEEHHSATNNYFITNMIHVLNTNEITLNNTNILNLDIDLPSNSIDYDRIGQVIGEQLYEAGQDARVGTNSTVSNTFDSASFDEASNKVTRNRTMVNDIISGFDSLTPPSQVPQITVSDLKMYSFQIPIAGRTVAVDMTPHQSKIEFFRALILLLFWFSSWFTLARLIVGFLQLF